MSNEVGLSRSEFEALSVQRAISRHSKQNECSHFFAVRTNSVNVACIGCGQSYSSSLTWNNSNRVYFANIERAAETCDHDVRPMGQNGVVQCLHCRNQWRDRQAFDEFTRLKQQKAMTRMLEVMGQSDKQSRMKGNW